MIKCSFEDDGKASLRHVTVDCLIIKDNQILLVKRSASLSNPNKYALPGGFLSRDETTTQAAKREALEETGNEVELTKLFRITDNPYRRGEDRQNVNFTFLAKVIREVQAHDKEVQHVSWFNLDKLPPEEEIAFDHFETITLYMDYLKKPFSLPFTASSI